MGADDKLYDYFCGECGKTFQSVYVESPTCTYCKHQMGDADRYYQAPFRPPGYKERPRRVDWFWVLYPMFAAGKRAAFRQGEVAIPIIKELDRLLYLIRGKIPDETPRFPDGFAFAEKIGQGIGARLKLSCSTYTAFGYLTYCDGGRGWRVTKIDEDYPWWYYEAAIRLATEQYPEG